MGEEFPWGIPGRLSSYLRLTYIKNIPECPRHIGGTNYKEVMGAAVGNLVILSSMLHSTHRPLLGWRKVFK